MIEEGRGEGEKNELPSQKFGRAVNLKLSLFKPRR